jgi:hypothetical protein
LFPSSFATFSPLLLIPLLLCSEQLLAQAQAQAQAQVGGYLINYILKLSIMGVGTT